MSTQMLPWDLYLLRLPASHPADQPIHRDVPAGADDASWRGIVEAATHRPALREAIRLSSPSLAAVVDRPDRAAGMTTAQLRRAALSLLKYDTRMRARPTPFGLFAGVAVGRYGDAAVQVTGPARRQILPDMGWLLTIVARLELHPQILCRLSVQAFTPLVVRGDRIHVDPPSSTVTEPGKLTPTTVRVRRTPAIDDIVATADRPIPVGALIEALLHRHGGRPEAVLSLIRGLCQRGLLLTSLRPRLDGVDPLAHVVAELAFVEDSPAWDPEVRRDVEGLRRIDRLRTAIDHHPAADLTPLLDAAREVHRHDTPLHLNLGMGVEVTLPASVRDDAARAVDLMRDLAPIRLGMRSLRSWHSDFLERYGVDRLVPVLEALDPAAGLGAPAGYEWPASEAPEQQNTADPDRDLRRDRTLADLVARSHRDRLREVVLDDHTLRILSTDPRPEHTQSSCELYALLASSSLDDITAGEYRLVVAPNPGSHQAGATFGRFMGLFDADTHTAVAAAAARQTAPVAGAAVVSLSYQPRSPKAANIAHAPGVGRRRIGVGLMSDDSGAEPDPLCLDDLAVGATLDRLYLMHLPTGEEIVPTTQTMLSPGSQAPNVARFLFEIGMEGQRLWEPWDWGPAGAAPYLPRVRVGRIVLCPATWKLDSLRAAAQAAPGETDLVRVGAAIDRWRRAWDVPDQVIALSSDQRLSLDLTEPWHQLLLWTETLRDPSLVVQEPPAGVTHDWFRADGLPPRPVELVVPMSRHPLLPQQQPARTPQPVRIVSGRRHAPGSEWLYLHLNTPNAFQNEVLRQHLPTLLADLEAAGSDGWFFLRYSLPQPHLRIRWHLPSEADLTKTLAVLSETVERWHAQHLVGEWTLDTYEPEWERYGGPSLQRQIEQVFHADSVACVQLLTLGAEPGWPFTDDEVAAVSMTSAAHAFGSPAPTSAFVDHIQGATDPAAAWLARTGLPRDVPPTVRRARSHWQQLLDPTGGWPLLRSNDTGRRLLSVLDARDAAIAAYADAVRGIAAAGSPTEIRAVGSVMHMVFNRLLGGPPDREQAALAAARMATTAHWERRRHQR